VGPCVLHVIKYSVDYSTWTYSCQVDSKWALRTYKVSSSNTTERIRRQCMAYTDRECRPRHATAACSLQIQGEQDSIMGSRKCCKLVDFLATCYTFRDLCRTCARTRVPRACLESDSTSIKSHIFVTCSLVKLIFTTFQFYLFIVITVSCCVQAQVIYW
jgi:hypothetical protein